CNPGPIGLTITPNAPVQPGDTIVRTVTAPAGSFVLLVHGPNLGSTTLPFLNANLCLGFPFGIHFFGMVPASGTLTHQNTVPLTAPLPGNVTIQFQALALSMTGGSLSVQTSNLDSLTF
ncbi:MAG: hypothetical protein ACREIU_06005, partial [Planctomycetota bacterium]